MYVQSGRVLLVIGLVVVGLITFVDFLSLSHQHLLSPITSIAVNAVTEDVARPHYNNNTFTTQKQQSAAMGSQRRCNVLKFEHNAGQWVKTNFSQDVTWPCCGWDKSFRKYPNQCGTRPMSRSPFRSYAGNRQFYAHVGGHGCSGACDPDPTIGSFISAQWTPNNCALSLFNATHFCSNVLRNRSLLVVGDSTMAQTASVLMNAVHQNCPEQIRHAQSDTLIPMEGVSERGSPWNIQVDRFDPDIVLLNAGPHIHSEEDYKTMMEKVYEQFNEQFGDTQKLLIWKTINPPGYPALGILDKAYNLDDPQIWEKIMKPLRKMQRYKKKYTWDLFPKFDRMAKHYFKSRGVAVLDVYPLRYRFDNHPQLDVHHCTHGNGALRLIPQLLQALLEELDQA